MKLFKRHMGRRAAGVGVAVALLVLGLEAPAYAAVPTITSMLPASPNGNCEATITGTSFQLVANGGPVTLATFQQGANPAVTDAIAAGDIDADTQLQVDIPSSLVNSTSTTLSLTNTTGASAAFTFTTGAADGSCPAVPTFTPSTGAVGTSVTITPQGGGTFVTPPTAVRFNTTLATPTASTATSVTATVPCGATTGEIHVYTAAGQSRSTGNFTVTGGGGAPTITSFAPISGPVGTSVKITGTNFSGTGITGTSVTFNNVAATSVVNSATQITATVPSTATTGKIKVTTSCGSATSTTDFTVSTVHARSITLKLVKHLVAKGHVSVGDGFTACASSVPVKIQRRVSGSWKNVGSTTTSASGSYKKKIKDKPGKYRAKAPKVTLNAGVDLCKVDTSPVKKNT
jgi:IPT/TIG domain